MFSDGNRTFAKESVAQDPKIAKLPTMNDLPFPCGCWKEAYKCNQKKYNKQLGIGLAMLITAISYVSVLIENLNRRTVRIIFSNEFRLQPMATGNIFFNYFPPPFPEIYKEELSKQ